MRNIYQTKTLVRHNGKYLLLKKIRDIHADHVGGWEVPGGKINEKEDPTQGAMREVKEETGLNCDILAELKFLELEKNNIKTRTHVYLAEVDNDKIILSNEHSDYIWVSLEEIDTLEKVIYKDLFKLYVIAANKIKKRA